MKRILALSITAAVACAGSGGAVGSSNPVGTKVVVVAQDFDLAPSGTATIDGGALTLTFDKVAGDSRCPTGVQCIWAGNGAVVLTVAPAGTASYSVQLNTTLTPSTATAGTYRISLVGLKPYPKQGSVIPAASYIATLRVDKE
jgi:hypothetical protein